MRPRWTELLGESFIKARQGLQSGPVPQNVPRLLLHAHTEIQFIPKAPDAAAGNQDTISHELPVLRLERRKNMTAFQRAVRAGLRHARPYGGEGGTEAGNTD